MKRWEFNIVMTTGQSYTLYAETIEQAHDEWRKLNYSGTPIRFVRLANYIGQECKVNLAHVAFARWVGAVEAVES